MKNLQFALLTAGCLLIIFYLLQNEYIIQRSEDNQNKYIIERSEDDQNEYIIERSKDDQNEYIIERSKDDQNEYIIERSKDDQNEYIIERSRDDQNEYIIQRSKDNQGDDSSLNKFSSLNEFIPLSSSDFKEVKTFVIFLGHQRSGHSIVGSLLDAHPHIILANEGRLFFKLDEDKPRYDDKLSIFNALWKNSIQSSNSGLRTEEQKALVKGYTLSIDGLYQGTFVPPVQVIGDKNGGQTTLMFLDDPSKWERLFFKLKSMLNNIPIKVIHVIRNPYDNIATEILYKSGGPKKTTKTKQYNITREIDLNKIKYYIDRYFTMFQAIQQMKSNYDLNYLEVHGKDLIENPKTILLSMCEFLGVSCSDDYLEICSNKMFKTESKTRYNLKWTNELLSDVQESIMKFDNLKRYSFNS